MRQEALLWPAHQAVRDIMAMVQTILSIYHFATDFSLIFVKTGPATMVPKKNPNPTTTQPKIMLTLGPQTIEEYLRFFIY